jgi:hypothetical protein
MDRIAFGRGKRKAWKKVRSTGGMCFTVSWDRLEQILRNKESAYISSLKSNEHVHRFEIDEFGVTVFFDKKDAK